MYQDFLRKQSMIFFVLKKDAAHPSMTYNYIATFLIDKLNILLIHADFETCRGHITVRMFILPVGTRINRENDICVSA